MPALSNQHFKKCFRILLFSLITLCVQLRAQNLTESARIEKLVQRWSEAHNDADIVTLKDLYDSRVLYYTQNLSRKQCLENKRRLLLAKGNYSQEIVSPVVITAYQKGLIKCEFKKKARFKDLEQQSQAYLVLKKYRGKYLITAESDVNKDNFLSYNLDLGEKMPYGFDRSVSLAKEERIPAHIVNTIVLVFFILVVSALLLYRNKKLSAKNFADQN